MQSYYVLSITDDGPYFEVVSEVVLKARLAEDYYGSTVEFMEPRGLVDLNRGGNRLVIIKGEAIIPTAVQRVTEYKL